VDGTTIDLDGPVHYVDHGGDGSPMVLVHGLGGSHLNWFDVAPELAASHRVLAVDLVGHGYTPPDGRRPTVGGHASLVEDFIDAMGLGPAIVVGVSMGGLVAMTVTERSPQRVLALGLIDPALPVHSLKVVNRDMLLRIAAPVIPGLGGPLLRRLYGNTTPEEQVEGTLEFVCADPSQVSREHREVATRFAAERREMPWAIDAFVTSARSVTATVANRWRIRAMVMRIAVPTLLIHGTEDRLVGVESARWVSRIRPDWRVEILEGIGHVPQIEAPETTADLILDWTSAI
jgi:pimeloyl-ACP methyl ester carboxylesterase